MGFMAFLPMIMSMLGSSANKPGPQLSGATVAPQKDTTLGNALQMGGLAGSMGNMSSMFGKGGFSGGFQSALNSAKTTPNLPKGVKPLGSDIG